MLIGVFGQEEKPIVKNQTIVNNSGIIMNRPRFKKGKNMCDYNIYKKNHLITSKDAVYVFDLGHL